MGDMIKPRNSRAAIDIPAEEFRQMGHRLVDDIASFLDTIRQHPVTPGRKPSEIRALVGDGPLPRHGADPASILREATELLFANSTFNGHPRFFGYITASAAPIGILGELLAATVNPNVGAWTLSPAATEIELQAVRWLAELTGFPAKSAGIFVSGGNMANMVGFLAARASVMKDRPAGDSVLLRVYGSAETHTWIDKALDIAGLSRESFRQLAVDRRGMVSPSELEDLIDEDRRAGRLPFLVIATAGTTNTGAVDPIEAIASVCDESGVWLHVDGAYGAPVAALPEASPDLRAIGRARSLAIDPHKWLYAPLEAGCTLVRYRADLEHAFTHHPHYYHFEDIEGEAPTNFHELGPQNSRGFRALKVWLAMKHAGRDGIVKMIAEDIALAREMFDSVSREPLLEAFTSDLSIVTFRFVPEDLRAKAGEHLEYLNRLNEELVSSIQNEGEMYVSNGTIDGKFVLRACIVNFRTTLEDVRAVPGIAVRTGVRIDRELRAS